jgi:hypothetical protein
MPEALSAATCGHVGREFCIFPGVGEIAVVTENENAIVTRLPDRLKDVWRMQRFSLDVTAKPLCRRHRPDRNPAFMGRAQDRQSMLGLSHPYPLSGGGLGPT